MIKVDMEAWLYTMWDLKISYSKTTFFLSLRIEFQIKREW